MKKIIAIIILFNFISCGNTDDGNPILPNVSVNVTLNLSLPLYQDLNFDNSSAFVENYGIKGIIVFRFSENNILAWDAACPHISPNQCSTMAVVGVKMVCACDDTEFNILNGSPLSGTQYNAKQYKAIKNGNSITITNF